MNWIKSLAAASAVVFALAGCGGGGNPGTSVFSGTTTTGTGTGTGTTTTVTLPTMSVALSSTTVAGATPATVTATVLDAKANPVPGIVVTFASPGGLGTFSAATALTDTSGHATVTLSPANSTVSGADAVVATATVTGTALTAQAGYQLTATAVTFTSLTAEVGTAAATPLSAYGQAVLTAQLSGVNDSSPVTVAFTSACVAAGKATISPTSSTSTTGNITLTYQDTGGCGSVRTTDVVTASVSGSGLQQQLTLFLTSPAANSISFTSATPTTIFLKGSGYAESSTVKFTVVDKANNPLPGQQVTLNLTTFAGGLLLDSGQAPVALTTDNNGQVSGIINSGTVPTPVRVTASLAGGISTVSNSLAVAVGLPSQLNFSLAAATLNIEGMDYDGTPNTFTVLAADRSGNPVPDGTSVLYWTEGGQIQATSQTTSSGTNGIATAIANFKSAQPKPADGHVTTLAYAIGEESFVDLNGNNVYDAGEPFQDLGDVVKDVLWDGIYDPTTDEYISLSLTGVSAGTSACTDFSATYPTLALNNTIPNRPNTCDAVWSSKTYVRRAVETVFSTSSARPLWASTAYLAGSCTTIALQPGSSSVTQPYPLVAPGDAWFGGAAGTLSFQVTDANPVRWNPMAAGSTITAAGSSNVTTTVTGGSPVPSTLTPSNTSITYLISTGTSGAVFVTFTSPSGTAVTYTIPVAVNGISITPAVGTFDSTTDQAPIQATVVDAAGQPVSGATVTFSPSTGSVSAVTPTNSLGVATAVLTGTSGTSGTLTVAVTAAVGCKSVVSSATASASYTAP